MLRAIPPSSRFWRIAPKLAGATVLLLVLAAVAMTVVSERAYTSQKVDEVTVNARILASTVTAALAFNDRNTAAEYSNTMAVIYHRLGWDAAAEQAAEKAVHASSMKANPIVLAQPELEQILQNAL